MKQKLETMMGALHEARIDHDHAESMLEEHSHHDPAIVCIWEVLSANTELLIAIAEVLHHHHSEKPMVTAPAQRTAL